MKPLEIIKEVFDLYRTYGDADYIGEPVSQIEHMVQSAQLAEAAGYGDEVILAAFFHDIGHICEMAGQAEKMDLYGVKSHEEIGSRFLRSKGFSPKICQLVENHVAAKRYLTFADESYYSKLSEASKKTLEFQGGKMSAGEAEVFEKSPLFEASVALRFWDEEAKMENQTMPPLRHFEEIAFRHLASNTR